MSDTSNRIDTAQLARLSGLTDRHLRDLASEGWLPKPVDGQYQLVPAIQGLLRYYREREQQRTLQDCYDSIGSCAAATRIPVTVLKHAKRRGCAAFRGSRVYLAPFIRWFFESPERSTVNYDQERAQHVVLQNAKLQVELRQLRREVVPVEDVRRVGAELGAAIRKVVTRLKEEEDEILKQLHLLHEHLGRWETPA